MSQDGPCDSDLPIDDSTPQTQDSKPNPGSCQDVPPDSSAPLLSPLNPERSKAQRPEETTDKADTSVGQPEPLAEGQEAICDLPVCDQAVSLEPEEEEAQENKENTLPQKEKSWGGWGSWGKSLLNSATSTVGQSLTSVKVKAGEALRLHKTSVGEEATEEEGGAEEKKDGCVETTHSHQSNSDEASSPDAPKKGVFSTITHAVQNTGKTVISGGLDALEFIGKKTMTVLAESDPGFKKTKTLMLKTASLSQILKEAKEKERARLSSQSVGGPTAQYSILFDEFQGLSHLEALEILSGDSEAKIQEFLSSLVDEEEEELKKELIVIKENFTKREEAIEEENDGSTKDNASDGEEFVSVLTELLFELHVAATPDKLNKARMKAHEWVSKVEQHVSTESASKETQNETVGDVGESQDKEQQQEAKGNEDKEQLEVKKEEEEEAKQDEAGEGNPNSLEAVFLSSVSSLAEVTARSIEQLHKVAELILHGQELEKPAKDQTQILNRLTCAMCKEVDCLAKKFSDTLLLVGAQRKAEDLNPFIDTVLLEGSNSTDYIHNAFQLLLPVLQISHVQSQWHRPTRNDEVPSQQ